MEAEVHPNYAAHLFRERDRVSDARLESIYKSHAAMLHRRCLQILGDEQEAFDALQDLFLHLSTKLDTFRGDARLTTWLYRIATNHCLNRLRSARSLSRLQQDLARQVQHDPVPDLERRELLLKLMEELDEEELQIAFHRHHDGMTQVEIAEVLGVTERTVRNRLDRLEQKLQARRARLERVAE
jgi:RNA polymerase sigma-70 factor, ECF subfamily